MDDSLMQEMAVLDEEAAANRAANLHIQAPDEDIWQELGGGGERQGNTPRARNTFFERVRRSFSGSGGPAGGNAQYKQVALGETEPTSRGLLGPDKGDEWAAVADLDLFFQRV